MIGWVRAFLLSLLCVCGLVRADSDPDAIDLYILLKQIKQLNQVIAHYEQDPARRSEVPLFSDQKNDLIHTFALRLLRNQEHIGIDIQKNLQKQAQLKQTLLKSSKGNDIYAYMLSTLELRNLEADQQMYDFLEKLRTSLDFFSQEKDVKTLSMAVLLKFEGAMAKTYVLPTDLNTLNLHHLQDTLDDYKLKLKTYLEVLHYIQQHPDQVLSKNILLSIDMQWILERIAAILNKLFPSSHGLQSAKILLSLALLLVLLTLRKLATTLFMKFLDLFVRFSRKNEQVQQRIRNSIITPISTFLLIYSFDISIDILHYPHPTPIKFNMYLGVIYISLLGWLGIALFKAYGAALLATLASKRNGFRREVVNLILKVAYFFIVTITILAVLKQLGFNISAIIASLGIGGLAVALAVKDLLANFFASVILLLDNSFGQGDWIVCGDVEGTVVEMGLRRTTVRGFDNALLFVPNSELAGKSIRNWNRRKVGRRIRMSIGLTYGSPRDKLVQCVHAIRTMLEQHPKIAKFSDLDASTKQELNAQQDYMMDREHIVSMDDLMGYKSNLFVFVDNFGDSSINILVYCFSRTVIWGEWLAVKEDVMLKIMQIVEELGLSFAFPSQSVYLESVPKSLGAREVPKC
ncbi:mechanosensitive ion channel family protein [Helicobacter salomonis]|uniref:mechanosensitive ion channel family protein n=1 Tax=Helicobacter salomonis TaxID=56878 RepID=UPI0018F7E758|nr:mechanosensitive ion channel family protein [Helicobacter salomonis]